jgi:hypothetical protein
MLFLEAVLMLGALSVAQAQPSAPPPPPTAPPESAPVPGAPPESQPPPGTPTENPAFEPAAPSPGAPATTAPAPAPTVKAPATQAGPLNHHGLVIGVGLGAGNISTSNCFDCGPGAAFEFHAGGMLSPRLALVGHLWTFSRSDAGVGTDHTLYTVAARYWAADRLWLEVGMGGANFKVTGDNVQVGGQTLVIAEKRGGLGLVGVAGLEALQAGTFALDLQLRLGRGFYGKGNVDDLAFMVGASWR